MILDSIILENFGAYANRQEAVLTPEHGKPIILFGGMNGGGKTTLLDAVQLAFYGSKARISNRGRLSYRDYLRDSIHRGVNPREGASITLRFRRMLEGETHNFELQRSWYEGTKGIIESFRVIRNGVIDDILTEHWDETIENYLPSRIAHLFFFDGEQIKDLAEGSHAAEILSTAIHSLLGLDLVDRLETDLKVFERRKKTEKLDQETSQKLSQSCGELEQIDLQQEKVAMDEGILVNEAGRLAKELKAKEERFRSEGGDLYLRRAEIEADLIALKSEKASHENQLRELAAGPLPLLLLRNMLYDVEQLTRHESNVRRARFILDSLASRDREVLASLKKQNFNAESIRKIAKILKVDRQGRVGLSKELLILDVEDSLPPRLSHLRNNLLPSAEKQAHTLLVSISNIDEKIFQLESMIDRIPAEERIAVVQHEIGTASRAHKAKLIELETLRARKHALQLQRNATEVRLDKLAECDMNNRFSDDDLQRILKHSQRVRNTLLRFRTRVVQRHTATIEALMLESFRHLLTKTELVSEISIHPETFETTLMGPDGNKLPFDRLSAGERQILATALLWGLARASGRQIPTIIDTPLGRLDSSHRSNLIERYFPLASHQVLLLSTDEEIMGAYYHSLKPFISSTYNLIYDNKIGKTHITKGYFIK